MTVDGLAAALRQELGEDVEVDLRHIGGGVWDLYVAPPSRSPAFALLSLLDGEDVVRVIYSQSEGTMPIREALALLRGWAAA